MDKTFSESWYRVANQKICLRPVVRTRRQNFRGERWIVLENPFSNQYFRLRPAAYEFVSRLRPDRTVEAGLAAMPRTVFPTPRPARRRSSSCSPSSISPTCCNTTWPPTARNCSSATKNASSAKSASGS
jgi:hypothetical protein